MGILCSGELQILRQQIKILNDQTKRIIQQRDSQKQQKFLFQMELQGINKKYQLLVKDYEISLQLRLKAQSQIKDLKQLVQKKDQEIRKRDEEKKNVCKDGKEVISTAQPEHGYQDNL